MNSYLVLHIGKRCQLCPQTRGSLAPSRWLSLAADGSVGHGCVCRHNTEKTVSTTLQRKGKERQRVKSDLLHDDRKTQLAKPAGDCLMQGKWRGYINWVSHLKQNCKIRKPWTRVAFALLLYEPCKSVHQPRSFPHQPHPNLYKLVTSAKTISVG